MRAALRRGSDYALARLGEATTWAGLGVLATSYGHALPADALGVIQSLGPMVAGMLIAMEGPK
jgi:hypothetical protein